MKKLFAICLIFHFFIVTIHAEGNDPVFNLVDVNSGLSSGVIYSLVQDQEGFIWIATSFGLCRYDGLNTKCYFHNPKNDNSISNSIILSLEVDRYDNIWIGGHNGISIFDKKKNKFSRFNNENSNLYSNTIFRISEIDGIIWISTSQGINYAKTSKDPTKISIEKGINVSGPSKVFKSSDNELLFQHKGFTHFYLDSVKNKLIIRDTITTQLTDAWVFEMLPDYKFLIFSETFGLHFLKNGVLKKINYKCAEAISEVRYIKLLYGNKLIVTTAKGMYLSNGIDMDNLEFELVTSKSFKDFDISMIACRYVYQSSDQTIWAGTYANGLLYFNINNSRFKNLFIPHGTKKDEVSLNRIRSVVEDGNKNILLGTADLKLVAYNPKDNQYTYLNDLIHQNNIKGEQIFHFCKKNENVIYITILGTGGGIVELECSNQRYQINNFFQKNNVLYTALSKKENSIWASGGGLIKVDLSTKKQEVTIINDYLKHEPQDVNEMVRTIKYHPEENILMVGTFKGLYLYYLDSSDMPYKYSRYINDTSNIYSLSNNLIRDIVVTKSKKVFIATDNGLNELIVKKDTVKFLNFYNKPSMPATKTMATIEDKDQNIWMNTIEGLIKYNYIDNKTTYFNKFDGLTSNELHEHAQCITNDGKIVLGSAFGANIFEPRKLVPNNNMALPVIHKLTINHTDININDNVNGRIVLTKDIFYTDTIILYKNDKSIALTFSALYFTANQNIRFKYKLEGFDNDFIYAKPTETKVLYSNLKGGNYKFILYVSNNDGVWNETPKVLNIIVIPPIWERLWFQTLILLIFILLIVLFFIKRINKIEKEKLLIEQIVAERTKELNSANISLSEINTILEERQQFIEEQDELIKSKNKTLEQANRTKDRLFSIVAHDLKNPIGTLNGFTDLLINKYDTASDEKRKKYIHNINILSIQLKTLVENILQWSRSQLGAIKINKQSYNISDQVLNLVSLYSNQAQTKGIEIVSNIEDSCIVNADYNIIDTILRNLISNAIKFTNSGTITITFDSENNRMSISDTGAGMSSEKVESLFSSSNNSEIGTKGEIGTGLGMSICKEFITLHGGEIWVESQLDVGTTISFSL